MNVEAMLVMMCVFPCHIGWQKLDEVILTFSSLIEKAGATQNVFHGESTKNEC
jgi:hypothetical protein